MSNKLNSYSFNYNVKEIPKELKEQIETNLPILSGTSLNVSLEELEKNIANSLKRPKGRPKGTIKINKPEEQQKSAWGKHGAYSFIAKGKIPSEKKHLIKFVSQERYKWIQQLGGTECLTYMEISLIDEATRLLLYCVMINDYLIRKGGEDIVYKDVETGELKMHSALSRNYMSYTKTYVNILKELNRINRASKKSGSVGDIASKIQTLIKKGN